MSKIILLTGTTGSTQVCLMGGNRTYFNQYRFKNPHGFSFGGYSITETVRAEMHVMLIFSDECRRRDVDSRARMPSLA